MSAASVCKIIALSCVVGAIGIYFGGYYPGANTIESSPIVETENGKVQGRMGISRNGKQYAEYLSIPYAEPPIGALRFEPPIPAKPWTGVKQVTEYPPYCAQMEAMIEGGRVYGQEDCLFLNVFTSGDFKTFSKNKPVMVFIHGGAFMVGNSEYVHPGYLIDEDIVLVTFHYRVGPLGFLNTGDDDLGIRGNMGMKDQNLVLRWVQQNIGKFGGDKDRVTLVGQSAGSSSVSFHMISKASEGLFHRAILLSGTALCPWAFLNNPAGTAKTYGGLLGCSTDNTSVMVECMRSMDWVELVSAQAVNMDPLTKLEVIRPSVETVIRDDTFLTEHPRKSLEGGRLSRVPVLMGVTSGEGVWKSARFEGLPELITEIDRNWVEHGGYLLFRKDTPPRDLQKLREFYFGLDAFTARSHTSFMQNLTNLFSDALFNEAVRTTAILHAKHGGQTYLYYYDYHSATRPSLYSVYKAVGARWQWIPGMVKMLYSMLVDIIWENYFGWEGPHQHGIPHGEETLMLFNLMPVGIPLSKNDLSLSRKYVKLLADFARNEAPLTFNQAMWPPVQTKDGQVIHPMKYMVLDNSNPGKLIPDPFTTRMKVWESIF